MATVRGVFFLLSFILASVVAAAEYVGGQADVTTPQVRLVEPEAVIRAGEPIKVHVAYSDDFVYCGDCGTRLPDGYGQRPQVPQQGHAHIYLQRIPEDGGFDENSAPDGVKSSFCVLNSSNSTTEIGPGFVRGECPGVIEPGRYRMCTVLQTDAHVLRVMAHPRHFPSIDCRIVTVIGR